MKSRGHYEKVEKAIAYIVDNVTSQPGLAEIAAHVNMSPFHFQRVFSDWAGISPTRFLRFLTKEYLSSRLMPSVSLDAAAHIAGLSSQSRVYDLFVTLEAMTPDEYRGQGRGISLQYGFHETIFGDCFIAITERGICALQFVDMDARQAAVDLLSKKWSKADITQDQRSTQDIVHRIFSDRSGQRLKLNLLVRGTNFQVKVWEALLLVPFGQLTTYQKIADFIGRSPAVRAVGTAVANNPIAYLIPCHRVIRKEGIIGGYRWGETRKAAIVGWEQSQTLECEACK